MEDDLGRTPWTSLLPGEFIFFVCISPLPRGGLLKFQIVAHGEPSEQQGGGVAIHMDKMMERSSWGRVAAGAKK